MKNTKNGEYIPETKKNAKSIYYPKYQYQMKKGGKKKSEKNYSTFLSFPRFIHNSSSIAIQQKADNVTMMMRAHMSNRNDSYTKKKNIYKKRRQQKNGTSLGNEKIAMTYVHCSHHITAHHKKEIETNTKKQMKWKIQIIK